MLSLITRAEQTAEKEHDAYQSKQRIMHDSHALGLLARLVIHEGAMLVLP